MVYNKVTKQYKTMEVIKMNKLLDEMIAFEDLRMDGREELGLGRTHRENFQGENGMQASDVPESDDDN